MCAVHVHAHSHSHTGIWILKPCLYQQRQRGRGGKKEKKLQHISGIFQLMMCGCGSTGEREPLTVLSLFRSQRAPCCIPVRCAYFGNSCGAPFFSLFYCIQFVCCSCTFLSGPVALSLSPLCLNLPFPLTSLLNLLSPSLLPYFLSWPGAVVLLRL